MSFGRVVAILISVVLILLGLMFLIAATDARAASPMGRALIGGLFAVGGVFLLVFILRQKTAPGGVPPGTVINQKIELSGDVQLESLSCARCGGAITQENISVQAGAAFVKCPFCGSNYQLEEKPKW